jgi:arylsulfatase A-like enzyme
MITADHGEELFEHGLIGHGATVYEEVLRIPLIMRFPERLGLAGLRLQTPADLLDIAPTILDIFGLGEADDDLALEGQSLLPVLHGAPGRSTFLGRSMHERPSYSLREGPDKLIFDTRTGRVELYRIPEDREETRNLAAEEPILAEYLRQTLLRKLRDLERRRGTRADRALPAEAEEALRALGYIE